MTNKNCSECSRRRWYQIGYSDAQKENLDMDVINELLDGKWVDSKKVQDALGLSFKECFSKFDFMRKAEWWSVVGETEEERQRNGQKVSTFFRIRTQ